MVQNEVIQLDACIQRLKNYIAEYPPIFEANGVDSILDTLYWNYTESNCLENDIIQKNRHTLYHLLKHLKIHDIDKIDDIICVLCIEHQRISFAAGVQVGIRLTQELQYAQPLRHGLTP